MDAELLIPGLLLAIVALASLAQVLNIPYPVVLVVGGAFIGFIPGLPQVELDPEVVLVVSSRRCCTARRSSRLRRLPAETSEVSR